MQICIEETCNEVSSSSICSSPDFCDNGGRITEFDATVNTGYLLQQINQTLIQNYQHEINTADIACITPSAKSCALPESHDIEILRSFKCTKMTLEKMIRKSLLF